MKTLEGKVAAITGAASGIGRATAEHLARRGCHVALSDVDESGLELAATACRALGVQVRSDRVDVAVRDQVYGWADAVAAWRGGVHVIVNNAGVALAATVWDATDEDLRWIMEVDFWGVVHGTRAFLPHLRAAGEGHVVNVSSVFGLAAMPLQSAYCSAKFAVRGFTEALAQELAIERSSVGATCVHPGGIRTSIARSGRIRSSDGWVDTRTQASFDRLLTRPPDHVARAIAAAILGGHRRVLVGWDALGLDLSQRAFPVLSQKMAEAAFRWLSRRARKESGHE